MTYVRREADAAAQLHCTRSSLCLCWQFVVAGEVCREDLGAEPERGAVAAPVVGLGELEGQAEMGIREGRDVFRPVRGEGHHGICFLFVDALELMTSSR